MPNVFEGLVKISNEREGLHPPWRMIPKVSILKDWLWIFSMLKFGLHECKSKHLGGGGRRVIYTSCKSTINGSTSNGKWRPFLFTFLRMCREIYMCIINVHQSPMWIYYVLDYPWLWWMLVVCQIPCISQIRVTRNFKNMYVMVNDRHISNPSVWVPTYLQYIHYIYPIDLNR